MTKDQIIEELVGYKNDILSFPTFKGKAELRKRVASALNFLRRYKTDKNVERLMLKEGRKAYIQAVKKARTVKLSDKAIKGSKRCAHSLG